MAESKQLEFREPDWDALRESIRGPRGCTGICQGHKAIGSGRKVIGMRLEPCTHRCIRPEGHDDDHQCAYHIKRNPAFKKWRSKFHHKHDPCYNGFQYFEVDEDTKEDEVFNADEYINAHYFNDQGKELY